MLSKKPIKTITISARHHTATMNCEEHTREVVSEIIKKKQVPINFRLKAI